MKIVIGSVTAALTATLTALLIVLPGVVSSWVDQSSDANAAATVGPTEPLGGVSPTTGSATGLTTTAPVSSPETSAATATTTRPSSVPVTGDGSASPDDGKVVLANRLDSAGFYYVDTAYFEVAADSVSPPDASGTEYEASNVVDGDLSTAWQEGDKGRDELGLNSQLSFEFDDGLGFASTKFEIVDVYAGWQSPQPCLYERHARPTEVSVVAYTPTDREFPELFPEKHEAKSQPLITENGRTFLRVQLPAVSYTHMTLTVTGVEPGDTCGGAAPFDDMLISEVQFAGYDVCDFEERPYTDHQVAGYDVARYPGPGPHMYFPPGYDPGGVGC